MTSAGDQLFQVRFKPAELSPNAWAVKAGVSRTVWTDLRRHGNPSRRTLAKLLDAAQSSLAEFEALRVGDQPAFVLGAATTALGEAGPGWRAAPLPPLPLLASAAGGTWGESSRRIELMKFAPGDIAEQLPRPPSLATERDAYAVTIVGDSMRPRFRPGRRIAIAPGMPVDIGDDVLVQLAGPDADGWASMLVKELVRRTPSSIELRQHNPAQVFTVAFQDCAAIHKVAGELF